MTRLYRVPKTTASSDEAIEDPDVEAVVIATPTNTHFPLTLQALRNGKHVMVMKPLCTTSQEAEALIEEAEGRNLTLAVDHTFVYTGAVRKIKDLISSGEIGDIYYFDSVRINLGLFQHDVNVVWDLATHDVSIMDYVLDMVPAEVSAIGSCHFGTEVENIAYLTVRFADSVLGHVHVNWLAPAKVRSTIIGGSRKMLIYDDTEPTEKIRVYDKGVDVSWNNGEDGSEKVYEALVQYRSGDMYAPKIDQREALATEVDHFIRCVRTGETPISDARAGMRVVRILEAAQRSIHQNGTPVPLERQAAA
jgi:predicted dehydrogenase